MSQNVFDVLKERGYIAQVTHEDAVRAYLAEPGASFYIGFDPTADSLHVGHFVQMMVMAHLQRAGLKPIALMGGGTGMIGDPSGRTDLRQMMTPETIRHHVNCFRKQMSLLIDFSDDKALIVDNADWLLDLNYISFLREVGPHFTVNRMLAAEAYKQRMEKGLTFFEFNYMIMQAYDFLVLYEKYGCRLQLGGDDQWSNVLAGTDLIRRKTQGEAYGMTFNLLTTSEGTKMGKTARGALWLDPEKCPPFDFYQYWRNIDDADVINCLKLLTFVPMPEIEAYAKLTDAAINEAKVRLALEITSLIHGRDTAEACQAQAAALFSGAGRADDMATTELTASDLGSSLIDVLTAAGLFKSKSEARRLIQQGGLLLNQQPVDDIGRLLDASDFSDGEAIIRKGKKVHHRLLLV